MSASIELTMKRYREFVHIVLNTEKEVIFYAKKYIKEGWKVYSIDKGGKITLTYECD